MHMGCFMGSIRWGLYGNKLGIFYELKTIKIQEKNKKTVLVFIYIIIYEAISNIFHNFELSNS